MRGRKPRNTSPTKVIAYVRCSTDEQVKGVTLQAQRARIEAFAIATDRHIDEFIVDEGQSAKSLDRPGMQRVLEGVRSGLVRTVITLKLDRVTRSVRDLSELLETFGKAGASLVSVSEALDTESAAGRMVVNMLGVIGQWERETIGERTSFALGYKRAQRKAYGPVPFGYRRVGDDLEPDTRQQEALAMMRAMFKSGSSLRQIASALHERDIKPSRGLVWHAASVKAVLESKMTVEAA